MLAVGVADVGVCAVCLAGVCLSPTPAQYRGMQCGDAMWSVW